MRRRLATHVNYISFAMTLILLVLALGTGSASAQDSGNSEANLGLSPVGIDGAHFEITLSPGETHEITINVRNSGEADGLAYLYLADVSTRVNGGLGVGLEEASESPATWIDFGNETFAVEAKHDVKRTMEIQVPENARPGQHVTSIVMQSADEEAPQQPQSGMMLRTVSRQAIAVFITIAGPLEPNMQLHTAAHAYMSSRSVVSLTANNTGNVRMSTTGEFTILDKDGQELSTLPVAYDPVFAYTSTQFEVPLDSTLDPGDYIVSMWLDNERYGIRIESGPLPLHVPEPPAGSLADPATEDEDEDRTVIETQIVGIPTWMLLIAIPLAIIAGALLAFLALKRRMQQTMLASGVAHPQVVVQQSPAQNSTPTPIRRMTPPARTNDTTEDNT